MEIVKEKGSVLVYTHFEGRKYIDYTHYTFIDGRKFVMVVDFYDRNNYFIYDFETGGGAMTYNEVAGFLNLKANKRVTVIDVVEAFTQRLRNTGLTANELIDRWYKSFVEEENNIELCLISCLI